MLMILLIIMVAGMREFAQAITLVGLLIQLWSLKLVLWSGRLLIRWLRGRRSAK
jgi:hypothetical protein